MSGSTVNVGHLLHLVISFQDVLLVNAAGINPQPVLNPDLPRQSEEVI
jgi:hypothetical protein